MNGAHDGRPFDLNLLVAFDAIAHERNVTRAAEHAGVTQSAMSHSLRRLREHVGDPLLVRTARGMALTPRGEALVVPIRSALIAMRRALASPGAFDPKTAARAFSISSPDLFDALVLPPLLGRLRREAPNVDLAVTPLGVDGLAARLETGDLDVSVVPRIQGDDAALRLENLPSELRRKTVFHDHFVCLLRRGHPAGKKLSLHAFTSLSHVLVSPSGRGDGLVDDALAKRGAKRRIALRLPHFSTALEIVQRSDLVLTAPSALARLARSKAAVVAVAPPIALPRHSIDLIWHERFSADDGHRWLREVVIETARAAMVERAARRQRKDPGRR